MNPFQSSPGPEILAANKPKLPIEKTQQAQQMQGIGMPEQLAYTAAAHVTPEAFPTPAPSIGTQFQPNAATTEIVSGKPAGAAYDQNGQVTKPAGAFSIDANTVPSDAFSSNLTMQDVLARRSELEKAIQAEVGKAEVVSPEFTAANERLQRALVEGRAIQQSFVTGEIAPAGATGDFAQGIYSKRAGLNAIEADRANAALAVQQDIRQGNIAAANAKIAQVERQIQYQRDDEKGIADVMSVVAQSPDAPAGLLQKIQGSRNKFEAINLAGKYLQDPKQKYQLESLRLGNLLTEKSIAKVDFDMDMAERRLAQDAAGAAGKAVEEKAREVKGAKATFDALAGQISRLGDVIKHPGLSGAVGVKGYQRVTLNPTAEAQFTGYMKQLLSAETFAKISELKAQGVTLGPLTEKEWPKLESAASALNSWAEKDKDGNLTGKFIIDEASFKSELNNMIDARNKIQASLSDVVIDAEEDATLDQLTKPQFNGLDWFN